jgi:hypothetical protein
MQAKPSQYPPVELLEDRIRHGIVFAESTVRALREALELLEQGKREASGG